MPSLPYKWLVWWRPNPTLDGSSSPENGPAGLFQLVRCFGLVVCQPVGVAPGPWDACKSARDGLGWATADWYPVVV